MLADRKLPEAERAAAGEEAAGCDREAVAQWTAAAEQLMAAQAASSPSLENASQRYFR